MATFKDNADRTWEIKIDGPTIYKVREDCDPKFLLDDEKDDQNTFARMQNDDALLCRVLFLLCDKQRNERGITEADFHENVTGDTIDRATEAMLAAIINFTPRRKRGLLEAAAAKMQKLQEVGVAEATAMMNDPRVDAQMVEAIKQGLNAKVQAVIRQMSATSSPASAESTPAT